MKICSVCNEIVSANQRCALSNCPNKSSARPAPKSSKVIPGPTGRSDRAVQAGLDRAGDVARNATRRAAFAVTVIFAVLAATATIGFNFWSGSSKTNTSTTTSTNASAAIEASPQSMVSQEVWECNFDSQPFTVTLSESSYKFAPYNPDGGQLQGAVRILEEWDRGLAVTNLELVGSGAPEGRWAFVEDEYGGKRRALMAYAVESSGDGSECTPPGQAPQYEFN
jgi:hypothetical protein